MRYTRTVLLGTMALAMAAPVAGAQTPQARARAERTAQDAGERAILGITTGSSGDRDTLGLLITTITPGGPAEKAGLEEGNRIAAINGVNLRLSREDAGERDMSGLTSRRLSREMGKVKAGAEVELRVWQGGAYKNVKVKTVAAEELSPRRVTFTREERDDRPVLGLSLGSTGSRRDTLGVLIMGVEEDGPAEKAGLVEGDRIQSVNGVNVRVSSDDAGDDWVSSARSQRLRRELQKAKVGENIELRVWSGGQVKTVRVAPVRAGDLYKDRERSGMRMFFNEGGWLGGALAPVPPVPPMPAMAPRIQNNMIWMDGDEMAIDGEMIRARVESALERAREATERAAERASRVRIVAPRVQVLPRTQLQAAPAPVRARQVVWL